MSKVFDAYGKYYDLLYSDKDYEAEADYVSAIIQAHVPNAKRILELGCGTGGHAEHLARLGYSVHGVDLSEAMLVLAQKRWNKLPEQTKTRLSFSLGDIRSLRTGQTYDTVISLFHVMSYQTQNVDLKAVFATASEHLRPGGMFLFDFWYGPAVLAQRPEIRIKELEDDAIKIHRTAEPLLKVNENVVDVHYTTTVEESATGRSEAIRETHRMRYLFLPELAELYSPYFDLASTTAWMSNDALDLHSWSGVQVLMRR
jgi:SAM-dependent methyltransferase